jgi:hypothetical protein
MPIIRSPIITEELFALIWEIIPGALEDLNMAIALQSNYAEAYIIEV